MPHTRSAYKYFFATAVLFIAVSCSVEKNTGATRFYHGLTARYNIYFNGYESYKAGLDKINSGHQDDYGEVLNVFEYSSPETPSRCSADMEKAIQKASKLISLKSITARPEVKDNRQPQPAENDLINRKEYNEWVDDSYLLIGKARFHKHEFREASAVFDYCISQANDPLIKKEASVWQARLYSETGRFSDAYRILTEIDLETETSKSLKAMYYASMADLFLKQKRYSEAIEPLKSAIELASGKRTRYRLTYLLAQINSRTGNTTAAAELYREVVKMKPPYDVEFNARINIAGVFDVTSGSPQDLRRELERMLRDIKNKDFLDQIYFALGNLSMKEGNEAEAIMFYRKSAASTSLNPNQKGRTYLALADYFYSKPDFMKAGKYYDSTVMFLSEAHPDYNNLRTKSLNLNAVVSQLEIIQTEDSLQKVALMPEAERNALITDIINKITQAESQGTASAFTDRYNLGQFYENERRFQNNIEQEGKWYFYNQTALTFGRTEFRRRWGERRLEDNWRRSNKARITQTGETEGAETADAAKADSIKGPADYKSPEFYLSKLPLTDSLMNLSDSRIANAYLNAGKAYSEKIGDIGRASEILEKLLTRYPGNELVPEALYTLYRINSEKNSTKAEVYRQRLIGSHSSSEFARILTDPAYFQKKLADLKMVETMYQKAYDLFLNEDFTGAIAKCDEALKTFPDDGLAPKFALLKAYAIGRTSDQKALRDELSALVKKWPAKEESKKASELMAFIDKEQPELKLEEEKIIAEELFAKDTASAHVFLLVIMNPSFNINQATFDVISHNIDNYTNNNYRTQGELVNNKYITITVSGFKNFSSALDYYKTFNISELVRNPSQSPVFSFLINDSNLAVLKKDNNPERYRIFFMENYINEKNQDTVDR